MRLVTIILLVSTVLAVQAANGEVVGTPSPYSMGVYVVPGSDAVDYFVGDGQGQYFADPSFETVRINYYDGSYPANCVAVVMYKERDAGYVPCDDSTQQADDFDIPRWYHDFTDIFVGGGGVNIDGNDIGFYTRIGYLGQYVIAEVDFSEWIVRSPDLNGDGVVNLSDLQRFNVGFANQDPRADLNFDGVWNTSDIGRFTLAIGSSCN